MSLEYSAKFFERQKKDSYQSAQVIVPLILGLLPIKSVIDVGCGLGAWLKVFAENGIKDYQGIDGAWVDKKELLIPQKHFIVDNLEKKLHFTGKYDLTLCLELAEHLSLGRADDLIKFLTELSPLILFSAAIPGQDLYGQIRHVNEQWPEHWAKKFKALNFEPIDCLRDKIWFNEGVKYWYQQNIILYVSSEFLSNNPIWQKQVADPNKLARVHPKTYSEVLKYYKK